MGGGRGEFRRSAHAFMADKTKYEWADLAIDRAERIAKLEAALKVAYRFFGKDDADPVKRNEVRGIIARALGKQ